MQHIGSKNPGAGTDMDEKSCFSKVRKSEKKKKTSESTTVFFRTSKMVNPQVAQSNKKPGFSFMWGFPQMVVPPNHPF